MFGIFGRKNKQDRVEPTFDGSLDSGPKGNDSGKLSTVLVRQSVVEAVRSGSSRHELIEEVVNYTNFMMQTGLFRHDELPPEALQAYHADYYLAQVNNGGHSQFIHNSADNADRAWGDALTALKAMGASDHAAILTNMLTWVQRNPDAARQQTGFTDGDGRDPALDALDEAFYALEKHTPMSALLTAWIMNWSALKIVADASHSAALDETVRMNPHRADRLMAKRVAELNHQINDWLHVSIGMAGMACTPMEIRLAIGGGVHMELDGETQVLWTVRTDGGSRYALVTDKGAALYERIESGFKIDFNKPDEVFAAMEDGRLGNAQGDTVGERQSFVPGDVISTTIQVANRFKAAAAIDLLLRHAAIDAMKVSIVARSAPRPDDPVERIHWAVYTDTHPPFMAVTQEEGSALVAVDDNKVIAQVPAQAIAAHAAKYGM